MKSLSSKALQFALVTWGLIISREEDVSSILTFLTPSKLKVKLVEIREEKSVSESRIVKTSHVFPPDTNVHNTLFGGKLMAYIDDVASLAATRHARCPVVTASTDSVDFLSPVTMSDSVCLEGFVTWTGRSSMEVFVKVIAENLLTGERRIAATAFLTFVALDESKNPIVVPKVIPVTPEEKKLHETAEQRAQFRKLRREDSRKLAEHLSLRKPWEE